MSLGKGGLLAVILFGVMDRGFDLGLSKTFILIIIMKEIGRILKDRAEYDFIKGLDQ
jgi:hypothetical protein